MPAHGPSAVDDPHGGIGPHTGVEPTRSTAWLRAWPSAIGRDLTAQIENEIEGILFTEEGAMGAFVKVARVGDVPPGKMLTAMLAGQPVVLANVDGSIYAFSGVCSHADGPLGRGKLRGDVVECPFHGGQFEVRTGRAVMPPATENIPTFEVRVAGDDIQVALP